MARIVNIDEIVPEDITIRYRHVSYLLPGDPPVEYILSLWSAAEKMQEGQTPAEQHATMTNAQEKLLNVFRIANPDLESLPFGIQGTVTVMKLLFELYGLIDPDAPVAEEDDEEAPLARPKKSRRSSGSRG